MKGKSRVLSRVLAVADVGRERESESISLQVQLKTSLSQISVQKHTYVDASTWCTPTKEMYIHDRAQTRRPPGIGVLYEYT